MIENKDITLDTLAETLEIEKENLDERQRMYNENASQINTDLRNAAEGSVKAVSDQFMNMLFITREQGGEVTEENIRVANEILESYKGLPEEQRKNMLLSMVNMIDGITEKRPELASAATMSADEIEKSLREALELDSGESVPKEIGKKTNEEIEKGLDGEDGGAVKKAETIGENIALGLQAGIDSKKDGILTDVGNFVSTVLKKMSDVAGIHSPSKETARLGKYLSQGLAVGLAGEAGRTIGAIDSNMRKIMNRIQAAVTGETMRLEMGVRARGVQNVFIDSLKLRGADSDKTLSVTQTNYFNQPLESPAEVARALERQSKKLAKEID